VGLVLVLMEDGLMEDGLMEDGLLEDGLMEVGLVLEEGVLPWVGPIELVLAYGFELDLAEGLPLWPLS
jgi:hypothetical protein